jgi:hypothetical protein
MGPEHGVGFLVFDGVKLLDVAGPGEVFSEANVFGAEGPCSATGGGTPSEAIESRCRGRRQAG